MEFVDFELGSYNIGHPKGEPEWVEVTEMTLGELNSPYPGFFDEQGKPIRVLDAIKIFEEDDHGAQSTTISMNGRLSQAAKDKNTELAKQNAPTEQRIAAVISHRPPEEWLHS